MNAVWLQGFPYIKPTGNTSNLTDRTDTKDRGVNKPPTLLTTTTARKILVEILTALSRREIEQRTVRGDHIKPSRLEDQPMEWGN